MTWVLEELVLDVWLHYMQQGGPSWARGGILQMPCFSLWIPPLFMAVVAWGLWWTSCRQITISETLPQELVLRQKCLPNSARFVCSHLTYAHHHVRNNSPARTLNTFSRHVFMTRLQIISKQYDSPLIVVASLRAWLSQTVSSIRILTCVCICLLPMSSLLSQFILVC